MLSAMDQLNRAIDKRISHYALNRSEDAISSTFRCSLQLVSMLFSDIQIQRLGTQREEEIAYRMRILTYFAEERYCIGRLTFYSQVFPNEVHWLLKHTSN